MISLDEHLLQAVIEHPKDDQVRLIAADWWEEQGELERAELVRVQVELERIPFVRRKMVKPRTLVRQGLLREREYRLLKEHGPSFVPDLLPPPSFKGWSGMDPLTRRHVEPLVFEQMKHVSPQHPPNPRFEMEFVRGFVEEVRCTAEDFLRHVDEVRKVTPLRRVELTTGLDWHPPTASGGLKLIAGDSERLCKLTHDDEWWGNRGPVLEHVLEKEFPGLEVVQVIPTYGVPRFKPVVNAMAKQLKQGV